MGDKGDQAKGKRGDGGSVINDQDLETLQPFLSNGNNEDNEQATPEPEEVCAKNSMTYSQIHLWWLIIFRRTCH